MFFCACLAGRLGNRWESGDNSGGTFTLVGLETNVFLSNYAIHGL